MTEPVEIVDIPAARQIDRAWVDEAVRRIKADANRSADTHLLKLDARVPGVEIYLKDESTHPTGSLKHRLARSLFLYALCNGQIGPDTTVVEASSGSTAISEAHFARMIGVPFIAVMAKTTSPEKVALIEREGGVCHLVDDPSTVYDVAAELADDADGYYIDQFTYAERATDWRGNNNIAESIFEQMALEQHPVPRWIVVGAGTGGTSATIGRYTRYCGYHTELAVVDPEGSAFLAGFQHKPLDDCHASRVEGIGRPRVEPSFIPELVDRMLGVPDAASIAAMRYLRRTAGIGAGGSTGTNLYGTLRLACEMAERGETGSIVTLACDLANRYACTYDDDEWLGRQGIDIAPYDAVLEAAWQRGEWTG